MAKYTGLHELYEKLTKEEFCGFIMNVLQQEDYITRQFLVQNFMMDIDDISGFIKSSFKWYESFEGPQYWDNVYNKLKK